MGILFIIILILLFFIGPKYVWGFEAHYRRKLDDMSDNQLVQENNYLVSQINSGCSFENRRAYSVKIDKLAIVERKLKKRILK